MNPSSSKDYLLSAAKSTLEKLLRRGSSKRKATSVSDGPSSAGSLHDSHQDPIITVDFSKSVGSFLGKCEGKYYWSTNGPGCLVDAQFEQLCPELNTYLEDHTDPVFDVVFLSVFMVGRLKHQAVPTVIVCCKDEAYRKTSIAAIKDSGILDRYSDWKIDHLSQLPKCRGTLQMLGLASDHNEGHLQRSLSETGINKNTRYEPSSIRKSPASTLTGLPDKPDTVQRTAPIYSANIYAESNGLAAGQTIALRCQQATVGGAINVFGQIYFMTAAHPLSNDRTLGSISKVAELAPTRYRHAVGQLKVCSTWEAHTKSELDYTLFSANSHTKLLDPVPHDILYSKSVLRFPPCYHEYDYQHPHHGPVTAWGQPKASMTGRILPTAGFLRAPLVKKHQRVFPVQFDSPVPPGASGTWIVDASSTLLHGHIIAGSPEDGLAYIVPAYQVFEDIRGMVGRGEVFLPERLGRPETIADVVLCIKSLWYKDNRTDWAETRLNAFKKPSTTPVTRRTTLPVPYETSRTGFSTVELP